MRELGKSFMKFSAVRRFAPRRSLFGSGFAHGGPLQRAPFTFRPRRSAGRFWGASTVQPIRADLARKQLTSKLKGQRIPYSRPVTGGRFSFPKGSLQAVLARRPSLGQATATRRHLGGFKIRPQVGLAGSMRYRGGTYR